MTWTAKFILLAEHISQWSKDRSTKVGAVVVDPFGKNVLSMGYNGFPRGVDDDNEKRHERPAKYMYTAHAEANAVYNAARKGVELDGSVLYLNWTPTAICPQCAQAIIQAGIVEVVGPDRPFTSKGNNWDEQFAFTRAMFNEAKIRVSVSAETIL